MFRAAQRGQVATTLVANHALRTPPSPHIRAIQVPAGLDVADTVIVQQLQPGDLVATQDIPLAALVLLGLLVHVKQVAPGLRACGARKNDGAYVDTRLSDDAAPRVLRPGPPGCSSVTRHAALRALTLQSARRGGAQHHLTSH